MTTSPNTRIARIAWADSILNDEFVQCPQLNDGQPSGIILTKSCFGWRPAIGRIGLWLTPIPWLGRREYQVVPIGAITRVEITLGNEYRPTKFRFHLDASVALAPLLEFEVVWQHTLAWLQAIRRLGLHESGISRNDDPRTLRGYLKWSGHLLLYVLIVAVCLSGSFVVALFLPLNQRSAVLPLGVLSAVAVCALIQFWRYLRVEQ